MTHCLELEELARALAPGFCGDLTATAASLEAEIRSVTLFGDAEDCLGRLRRLGLKLWVASNLAPPYAVPLRSALAGLVDGFCFSFEAGSVKPESAFFERLCSSLGCRPGLALMVGDSLRSDVEGARAFGMRSLHLARGPRAVRPDGVRSLAELAEWLERYHAESHT
jgi:FMN phosphatase YigB (HAD superfamily)